MPSPTHTRTPEYQAALDEEKRLGPARCSDAAVMAGFCENTAQILVGAVSPVLVWQGAQLKGMTTRQLNDLCNTKPAAVFDLMWF
jgi:hypothetical protein